MGDYFYPPFEWNQLFNCFRVKLIEVIDFRWTFDFSFIETAIVAKDAFELIVLIVYRYKKYNYPLCFCSIILTYG